MVVPPSPSARRSAWWLLRVEGAAHSTPEFRVPDHEQWDLALRTDVVDALLAEGLRLASFPAAVTVVLQRPGEAGRHDDDLSWLSASRQALAARGLVGHFVVETRSGRRPPD